MANIDKNGLYCAYLRKSRRDEELEALGHGETLQRHEKQLRDLAGRLGIRIAQYYKEVVSGDTLAARPEAQRMLQDVNDGMWDGVLAMDVDRFGRGDSVDQGLIMQSLSYAGVLVITPDKIYDPSDDTDAEFFEIKLFFARREYNMIKKRMQRGRVASVMDGSYLGGPMPYGYDRHRLPGRKGGWTLKPNPEEAEIVRAMFTWYAYGIDGKPAGTLAIGQKLHELGVRTKKGNEFDASAIRCILHNPTYIGKVRWNYRTSVTKIVDGQRVTRRPRCDNPILVDGLHEAIVDPELWQLVQDKFAAKKVPPVNAKAIMSNPLSGLVICDQCGHTLHRKPSQRKGEPAFLYCATQRCATYATHVPVVEAAILEALQGWVREFEGTAAPQTPTVNATEAARAQLIAQRDVLEGQLARQYDALEQGLYTMDEFRRRRADIQSKIAAVDQALATLAEVPRPDPRRALIPQVKNVLAAYASAPTAQDKNILLKSVIDHVSYHKTERCYRNNAPGDHLSIVVYPRMPKDDL